MKADGSIDTSKPSAQLSLNTDGTIAVQQVDTASGNLVPNTKMLLLSQYYMTF